MSCEKKLVRQPATQPLKPAVAGDGGRPDQPGKRGCDGCCGRCSRQRGRAPGGA